MTGFQSIVRHSVKRSVSEPDDTADDGNENTDAEERDSGEAQDQDSTSDNQTLIRLLEPQEKVSLVSTKSLLVCWIFLRCHSWLSYCCCFCFCFSNTD